MQERYPTLRGISKILTTIGYIAITGGLLGALWALTQIFQDEVAAGAALLPIGWAVGMGLVWVALGELISVFIDIEANTRRTERAIASLSDPMPDGVDTSSGDNQRADTESEALSERAPVSSGRDQASPDETVSDDLSADELLFRARNIAGDKRPKFKRRACAYYSAFVERFPSHPEVSQACEELGKVRRQLAETVAEQ